MINIEQNDRTLTISFINKDGDVELKNIDIPPDELFEWNVTTNSKGDPIIRSWDGKPVRKTSTNHLNKYRVTEFLTQLPQNIQDEIFQFNVPKKYFCDIETEILDEFPDHQNPKAAITSISIANEKDLILVLSTKKASPEMIQIIEERLNDYFKEFHKKITFRFKYFTSEYEMLNSFFGDAVKKFPLITGWNFIDFDWNYLVGRALKLKVDVAKCSPTHKLDSNKKPLHKIVIDYLEIYKRWDTIVDIKETNGLDNVSELVLGVKKLKYSGSLNDLYRNDFTNFVLYNAIDSYLVKLIDEKLNTIMPYLKLGHITKSEADKAFTPVNMVENIMVEQLWKDRKRVFTSNDSYGERKKYEGAYVIEPKPGFHNYLATFDYSSLYPTTIRQWNISPDVFIKKDINAPITENTIKTSSGAIFKKNEDGVLKTLLTEIFRQRKENKNKAGDIKAEINELEHILKTK